MTDSTAAEDHPTQASISTSMSTKITGVVRPIATAMVAAAVATAIDAAAPSHLRPLTGTSDGEIIGGKQG